MTHAHAWELPYWTDVPGDHKHLHGDPILRSFEDSKLRVYALGGLHYMKGNDAPYFSLTAASWRRERGRWEEDAFGCCHDMLTGRWPELQPLADLHLSDCYGVPMYAEANGWYWLAGYGGGLGERWHGGNRDGSTSREDCLSIWCNHVRVPLAFGRLLADAWIHQGTERAREDAYVIGDGVIHVNKAVGLAVRRIHAGWIADQHERWQKEADECVRLLDLCYYYGDRWEKGAS